MKAFITRLLAFLLIFISYFLIVFVFNFLFKADLKKYCKSETLILGDSHTAYSLNPKIFPSDNFSQLAEPLAISYYKLKNILDLHKYKKVILGLSFHNISGFNDVKFIDIRWSNEMFRRYEEIIDQDFLKKIQYSKLNRIKAFFFKNCIIPKIDSGDEYIGRYIPTKKSDFSNSKDVILKHYFDHDSIVYNYSTISTNYLDSIIQLCGEKEIDLVLLQTPLHKDYTSHIPENYVIKFDSLISSYVDNSLTFLSYQNTNYADSLFLNIDHLNSYGAKEFSLKIKKVLAE